MLSSSEPNLTDVDKRKARQSIVLSQLYMPWTNVVLSGLFMTNWSETGLLLACLTPNSPKNFNLTLSLLFQKRCIRHDKVKPWREANIDEKRLKKHLRSRAKWMLLTARSRQNQWNAVNSVENLQVIFGKNAQLKMLHATSTQRGATGDSFASLRKRLAWLRKKTMHFLEQLEPRQAKTLWSGKLTLNNSPVCFKIDNGAVVTVIPKSIYNSLCPSPTLVKSNKTLFGPADTALPTHGYFMSKIEQDGKATEQEVFVVTGARQALLGCPAIVTQTCWKD